MTGQGLEGAVFNFFKDGGFEGSGTTDSNGNVSFSFTTSYYGASSSSKTYCTNYGSLTDDKKATVSTYTSYDAAYNAAYNEAYTKALNAANAAKNSTSHNYSATEVTARNGYYLNPGKYDSRTECCRGCIFKSVTCKCEDDRKHYDHERR